MKITVGMSEIEDYLELVRLGVDEVFVGYTPYYLNNPYINHAPVNRREVLYYQVQIGSLSDLKILSSMVEKYHVPVSITLNALSYLPEQYPLIKKLVEECLACNINRFIISDHCLLTYLQKEDLLKQMEIHLSGEIGEMNRYILELCNEYNIKRLIFHRKVPINNMKLIISNNSLLEYEAFALNEMCHFHGGYCNSLHCDELCHLCLVPYQMERKVVIEDTYNDSDLLGNSGCGLCSLWDLQEAGVEYLKVVGRGNLTQNRIRDLKAIRQANSILENSQSKEEYIMNMKKKLFLKGCSRNCYYEV